MQINDSVVFVTGANRGLGLAFVHALTAAGARKVYAASRTPQTLQMAGVASIQLDVTSPPDIAAAAEACGDVSILINNAGILDPQGGLLLSSGSADALNRELSTNVLGSLQLSQAFAPVLARNGGGAILNILSALSWVNMPGAATYAISKAAAWSMTNGLRHELQAQGTLVTGLHVGYMDTDMAHGVSGAKAGPQDVVRQALAALEAGQPEVLADEISRQIRARLSAEQAAYF